MKKIIMCLSKTFVLLTLIFVFFSEEKVYADIVPEQRTNDITWKIDDIGQLIISGSGDWERDANGEAPWREYEYRRNIKFAKVDLIGTTNCSKMFESQSNLKSVDLRGFDTSCVTNMEEMFYSCSALETIDAIDLDTSKVISMKSMFSHCNALVNFDASILDFDSCTTTNDMFVNCYSIQSVDLHGKNMENVVDMAGMFMGCSGLIAANLSRINARSLENTNAMFLGQMSASMRISSVNFTDFYAPNIKNMSGMFKYCTRLKKVDMSSIESDKVEKVTEMFYSTQIQELDMSGMDFGNVKTYYRLGNDWERMLASNSNLIIFKTPKNVHVSIELPNFNNNGAYQEMYYSLDGEIKSTRSIPQNISKSITLYKSRPTYVFKGFFYNQQKDFLNTECSVPETTGKDEALSKLSSRGYILADKGGVEEFIPIIISWRCATYNGDVQQSYDAIGDVYINDPSLNIGMIDFGQYDSFLVGKITVGSKPYTFGGYFLDSNGNFLNTSINLKKGTDYSSAMSKLSTSGYVLLNDAYSPITITWSCPDYNGNSVGSYHAVGTVQFADGITENKIDFNGNNPIIDAYFNIRGERDEAVLKRIEVIKSGKTGLKVQDTGKEITAGAVGSYFTDNGAACNDHPGGGLPCYANPHHPSDNCILFEGGIQCQGFAKFVIKSIFGESMFSGNVNNMNLVRINGDFAHKNDLDDNGRIRYSSDMNINNITELLNKAQIGDLVVLKVSNNGYTEHYAIVSGRDNNGIKLYDCNYGYTCQINENYYTYSSFRSSFTADGFDLVALRTAPDDWTVNLDGNDGSTPSDGNTGTDIFTAPANNQKENDTNNYASPSLIIGYNSSEQLSENTIIGKSQMFDGTQSLAGIKSEPRDAINQQIFAEAMAPKGYKVQKVYETYNIYASTKVKDKWKVAERTIVWNDSRVKKGDIIYVVWYCQEVKQNKLLPARVVSDGVIEFSVPRVGECSIVTIVKMKDVTVAPGAGGGGFR